MVTAGGLILTGTAREVQRFGNNCVTRTFLYQPVQSTFVVFARFIFWSAASVNRTSFRCRYQFNNLTYGLCVFTRPVVVRYIDHVFPSGSHQTACFGIKARYNVCLAGISGLCHTVLFIAVLCGVLCV